MNWLLPHPAGFVAILILSLLLIPPIILDTEDTVFSGNRYKVLPIIIFLGLLGGVAINFIIRYKEYYNLAMKGFLNCT